MNATVALNLVKLILALLAFFERQTWFQQGRAAAYAEMDEEQRKRLEIADAARRDADAFADGSVHDPRELP